MAKKPLLVVFDVEGVIIPAQRYFLEAIKLLGFRKQVDVLYYGATYALGLRSFRSALRHVYHQFQGVNLTDLTHTFDRIPLVPDADKVIRKLRESGITTAFISSSVAGILLERLVSRLGVDYAVGPRLEVLDERLTGMVSGDIIHDDGKAIELRRLLEKLQITPEDCAVVADDRNNLSMFHLGVRSIGFNPDFILTPHCEYVVRGDLKQILPFIDSSIPTERRQPSFGVREAIHIGSFVIPLVCRFLGVNRLLVSSLIVLVSLGYLMSEVTRLRGRSLPPFTIVTRSATVAQERWDYAIAPLLFAIGIVSTLLIFPPNVAFAAVTVATLGDGIAKVVGKRWGRWAIPFNKPKTVEGTLAGLVVSAVAASIYTSPLIALFAATVGMVVEALPSPVNDNLSVPLLAGLATSIVS